MRAGAGGAAGIAESGGSAAPERRYVSVLFADLVGFTELSDALDPEDLRELINRYQSLALATMERYGGFVARFSGDGVLVYFGYPVAHENDAERAVRAGLELIERLANIGAGLDKAQASQPAVRVGIHTGLLVFGPETASAGRLEHGAIGHALNVASRVQAEASPNSVVVTKETLDLIEGLFDAESLGLRRIKGLSREIVLHKIMKPRPGAHRFGSRSRRGATRMVARKSVLDRILRRWRRAAKESRCTTVHIIGEAGVGKTRLVAELCARPELADASVLQTNCHEMFASTPLYPVGSFLWARLATGLDEGETIASDRISPFLDQFGMNTAENREIVTALLGVAETAAGDESTQGPGLAKRRLFTFVISMIEQTARRRPTLIWVDDAHWLDASSAELVRDLVVRLADAPVLLLLTFRQFPEGPPLPEPDEVIQLRQLTKREALELAKCVPGAQALPERLLSQAAEVADGIPLFVEQLVLSFIDQGAEARAARTGRGQLPLSLTEIVGSTLDRLGGVRPVLQAAACIDRPFTPNFLAAVVQQEAKEVIAPLEALVRAEILRTRYQGGAMRYEFRHALLQQVAYESMVEPERRSVHARIVDVLARRSNQRPVLPEVLAHHLTCAAQYENAIDAWLRAGANAARRSAHIEAIEHLRRGLALVEKIEAPARRREFELNLLAALIGSLTSTQPASSSEYVEWCRRGIELCNAGPPTPLVFRFLFGQYNAAIASARLSEAAALADRFLSRAGHDSYATGLVIGHRLLGMALLGLGDSIGAKDQFERSIRLYSSERDMPATYVYGQNPKIYSQSMLSLTLFCRGEVDEALRVGIDALSAADLLRHPHSTVLALGFVGGYVFGLCGAQQELLRAARRMIAISEQHQLSHFRAFGAIHLGWALCQGGDFQQGISVLQPAIAALEKANFRLTLPFHLSILADAERGAGKLDEAQALCARAQHVIAETGQRWLEPEALRIEALIASELRPRDTVGTEALFQRAAACARQLDFPTFEFRCLLSLSRTLRRTSTEAEIRLKELSRFADMDIRAARAAQSFSALLSP
jgi:class 3 adenylate cyclase/tetratricopeptide (TPR) repeat protein